MNFPAKIKTIRQQNSLTQLQMGEIIGVSKVSVSGYESGKRVPDLATLTRIADHFNITVDYLLGREKISNMNADIVKEPNLPYIAFDHEKREELSLDEARRLKEELEMYRLYRDKENKKV